MTENELSRISSVPEIIIKGYRENDPERCVLNTDKIRTRTGWKPMISL